MKQYILSFIIFCFAIALQSQDQEIRKGRLNKEDFKLYQNKNFVHSKISDYRGKVVVLEFWATWCSPCIASMPHIDSLQKKYPNDIVVLALSNEEQDKVRKFIDKRSYSFHFGLDEKALLGEELQVKVLPTSVILNRDGIIVGITHPSMLNDASIGKILSNQPVSFETPKSALELLDVKSYLAKVKDTTRRYFSFDPGLPLVTAAYKKNWISGIFKNRRLSVLNSPLKEMFSIAFSHSKKRIVLNHELCLIYDPKNVYNADLVIDLPGQTLLLKEFQDKLLEATNSFVFSRSLVDTSVLVLQDLPNAKATNLKKSEFKYKSTMEDKDSSKFVGFGVKDLCSYLENKTDYLIENESQLDGIYDFSIPSMTNNSLEIVNKTLAKYDLEFIRRKREIQFILINRR